jgi:hypothetical protein
MNILKSTMIGFVLFLTFTGSVFFVSWLEPSATQIKGQIYIDGSNGKRIKLNNVPILLIKKSVAQEINRYPVNKLFLLKKHLSLAKLVTFSDGEGKFSLDMPGHEYSIAVLATKTNDGESGVFFWLMEVHDKQKSQIISLNNNNLTDDFVAEEED